MESQDCVQTRNLVPRGNSCATGRRAGAVLGARLGLGLTEGMRFHGRNFVAPWNDGWGVLMIEEQTACREKQTACRVKIEKANEGLPEQSDPSSYRDCGERCGLILRMDKRSLGIIRLLGFKNAPKRTEHTRKCYPASLKLPWFVLNRPQVIGLTGTGDQIHRNR